jgi:N6-adenosine-specific RNA methylase IME4
MKIDPAMLAGLPFELQAEISENLFRKDWTPSEIDAIRRRCEVLLKAQAKKNQASAGPSSGRGAKRNGGGNFPQAVKGKTRDKIGAFAGVSGRTIERIAAIVDAAEAEPKRFGKLKQDMDRTGRINGLYKRLKVARQAAEIRKEPPPLPGRGPYRVIVADPAWPYEIRREDPSHRANTPYPQMSIAQICAVKVQEIAHPDCVLFLWTTNYHLLRNVAPVLDAWGFEERTILTWDKDKMGTGDWLRGQTEHCVMAGRGKPAIMLTIQTTLLRAAARAHSEKPIEFYNLVESLCPAPRYAYLFSRYQHNDKWDCHGDEAPMPHVNRGGAT